MAANLEAFVDKDTLQVFNSDFYHLSQEAIEDLESQGVKKLCLNRKFADGHVKVMCGPLSQFKEGFLSWEIILLAIVLIFVVVVIFLPGIN